MFVERTSVGLDVHARSIAAAAIDTTTGEFFKDTLVPKPEVVIDWIRHLPGPVAVTYEAGPTGFGLARALHEAGLSVPHDISVTGFDDIAIAQYLLPPLTTLRQLKQDLGGQAAALMLRILDARGVAGRLPRPERHCLQGELIVRASTARLAADRGPRRRQR